MSMIHDTTAKAVDLFHTHFDSLEPVKYIPYNSIMMEDVPEGTVTQRSMNSVLQSDQIHILLDNSHIISNPVANAELPTTIEFSSRNIDLMFADDIPRTPMLEISTGIIPIEAVTKIDADIRGHEFTEERLNKLKPNLSYPGIPIIIDGIYKGVFRRVSTVRRRRQYKLYWFSSPFIHVAYGHAEVPEVDKLFIGVEQAITHVIDRGWDQFHSIDEWADANMSPEIFALFGRAMSIDLADGFKKELTSKIESLWNERLGLQQRSAQVAMRIAPLSATRKALKDHSLVINVEKFNHPEIEKIYISTDSDEHSSLHFTTKDIHLEPSDWGDVPPVEDGIDIGAYEITIPMNDASDLSMSGIRFKTLRSTIGGYSDQYMQHPHVFNDMTACFGDFGDPIMVAQEEYDYQSVIDLIFMFLQQADSDDCAGRYWPSWSSQFDDFSYMSDEGYVGNDREEDNDDNYPDEEDDDEEVDISPRHHTATAPVSVEVEEAVRRATNFMERE